MTGPDIATNLFHLAFFSIAHAVFIYAIYYRLRIILKGQSVPNMAGIEQRIRHFLFNVLFQQKLFKHPIRGFMHALVFFGFIAYSLVHTPSQMIAGNLWVVLKTSGIDPYTFFLTDYLPLELALTPGQAGLILVGLVVLMVVTFAVMRGIDPSHNAEMKLSAGVQWLFLLALLAQFGGALAVLMAMGTHFYETALQYFSIFVLTGLGYFAYRRWLLRAKGLDIPSAASFIVLSLIGNLMVWTMISGAAQISLDGGKHSNWISGLLIKGLMGLGMTDAYTAGALRNFGWWMHIITVYVFMLYLPTSKHSHLIFAPINFFMIKNQPRGQMNNMNFETSEVYGAGNVSEMPWVNLVDGLSCIECGRCTIQCPANRTGKKLDPKMIMVHMKHAMMDHADAILKHKDEGPAPSPLIGDRYVTDEELWACTTCYACVEACPVGNNQVEAILEMRRNLVQVESRFPQMIQNTYNNYETNGNPWGIASADRGAWAEGLGVPRMSEIGDASKIDVLYWVGSAGSYDDRNRKVAAAFVKILKQAGVKFAILAEEEYATGDTARRTGNEYLFQTLADQNIETLKKYNVKKIVTASPHSYNCLKNDYPQRGGHYEVWHHTEFIAKLVKEGKIDFDPSTVDQMGSRRVTYHDACFLGRYNNIYDQPRQLLERATGKAISEAVDHHSTSLCCGAGGGQMWVEEEFERVNMKRTAQLVDTGADLIATACPFCMTMITDGIKANHLEATVEVKDIAEVIAAAMKGGDGAFKGGFEKAAAGAGHGH